MVRTENFEDKRVFTFQLIISVAHEITHFLTGFLSGPERAITPEGVSIDGWNEEGGEAGRFWEFEFVGGIIEFYARPGDRNPDQCRTPFIFENYLSNSPGKPASMAYIVRVFDGRKFGSVC